MQSPKKDQKVGGTQSKLAERINSLQEKVRRIFNGHFRWIEGESAFRYLNSPPYGNDVYNKNRPIDPSHYSYSPPGVHMEIYNLQRRDEFIASLRETNILQSVAQKRHALMMHRQLMNEMDKGVELPNQLSISNSPSRSASSETAVEFSDEDANYNNRN
ncbi:hypothetical protein TTRE_0000779901 [Trichuris trichiura]|uniref:Uncharacterized protein n=1 Tax=Trichuris trichiura TaxID=36087 RepID=A0A077ZLE1_TRITR|nr:hypothetical protein TTRE_0000779901 [Trichuris trichiura]